MPGEVSMLEWAAAAGFVALATVGFVWALLGRDRVR